MSMTLLVGSSLTCKACCRDTYQGLITGLSIRPLKIRAGRNLAVQMPVPTDKQTQEFKKTGKVPKAVRKNAPVKAVAPSAQQ